MISRSAEETRAIGADLAKKLRAGDAVFLQGPLGAGKTTLVRGFLESLGHEGPVRSPTFNLVQTFSTNPPVMHADLYRVKSAAGIGIEDYLETHICLIEWPDRIGDLIDEDTAWTVSIEFEGDARKLSIQPPTQ